MIYTLQDELVKVKQEVCSLKREVREVKQVENAAPPVGQYMQLYFKEPIVIDEALNILLACIEEGIKQKCLKKDAICTVEHVAEFVQNPKQGW